MFNLVNSYFKSELQNVIKNGIKINIMGELNKLPQKLKLVLRETAKKTEKNKKILVNLALNYGSKKEIINTFNKIKSKKITEKIVKNSLYTKNIPDPDILIRTGGKKRLSNFMLWQLAYSELFFLDKLWPDFMPSDLKKILTHFNRTKRNFGGI